MKDKIEEHGYSNLLLLLVIVSIGSALRFYGFFDLPFTHDELSALHRLRFDSFYMLIEKGVKEDVHPAGVQVFLYGWTTIFGNSEEAVKLPFLLMGVGSIVLSYFVASKWTNRSAALLVAASVATLQLPVMYSQIARPYASGLFFSLIMVWFWTKLVFGHDKKKLTLIGFVLSASICCYNHHFSLLFAFLVCMTGIFFLKKSIVKTYLLACLCIFVLYIPHLPILFHQLFGRTGLNWLARPDFLFTIDHIKHIFHYSPFVYSSVLILAVTGILSGYVVRISKFQVIAISWFVLPLLIGLGYSIYVKPVIQHSVLIFSFPFLLIFIFSFFSTTSLPLKILSLTVIFVVNITTLILTREHYSIFYKQPFKQFSVLTSDFFTNHNPSNTTIIFNENPHYIDYYFTAMNPSTDYFSMADTNIGPVAFKRFISDKQSQYLITGNIPKNYIPIVQEVYPSMIFKEFGSTYEYYIFSKAQHGQASLNDVIYENEMAFEGDKAKNWNNTDCITENKPDQAVCSLSPDTEWGPTFESKLSSMVQTRHVFVDISVSFRADKKKPGLIVCALNDEDGNEIVWTSNSIQHFYDSTTSDQWQNAYHTLRLTNHFDNNGQLKACSLKTYFWNKNGVSLQLNNMSIRARQGNKKVYGLVENMD